MPSQINVYYIDLKGTYHNVKFTENGGAAARAMSWINASWRPLLSELICTLLLVTLSISSSLPGADGKPVPLVYVAIATSCVVAANVASFAEFSGANMNPALTLTAVLVGRIPPVLGLGYATAQCVGAMLGFLILTVLIPGTREASFGVILPAAGISPLVAMTYEVVLTGLVMLVVGSILSSSEPNPLVPVSLGVAVIAVVMSGVRYEFTFLALTTQLCQSNP